MRTWKERLCQFTVSPSTSTWGNHW
jgi:hypothetical protein